MKSNSLKLCCSKAKYEIHLSVNLIFNLKGIKESLLVHVEPTITSIICKGAHNETFFPPNPETLMHICNKRMTQLETQSLCQYKRIPIATVQPQALTECTQPDAHYEFKLKFTQLVFKAIWKMVQLETIILKGKSFYSYSLFKFLRL